MDGAGVENRKVLLQKTTGSILAPPSAHPLQIHYYLRTRRSKWIIRGSIVCRIEWPKGITISVAYNQNTIHINLFSSIVDWSLKHCRTPLGREKRNGLGVIKEHVEGVPLGAGVFGVPGARASACPFHNTCFSYTKVISSDLFSFVLFPPKFKRLPR